MKASPTILDLAIERCLVNPTKEMATAFRKLPSTHKWMLFALLEAERDSFSGSSGNLGEVKGRYSIMCPLEEQQPFESVVMELTEAFIRQIKARNQLSILEWIHPSCRDLTIQELAKHVKMRQRFLQCCSDAGLQLAVSAGGGTKGELIAPLLVNEQDWEILKCRSIAAVEKSPRLLTVIWHTCRVLVGRQVAPEISSRLYELIKILWPSFLRSLKEKHRGHFCIGIHELHSLLEIRGSIDASSEFPGLEQRMFESCNDVLSALDDRKSITEAGSAISAFAALCSLLHDYASGIFRKKRVQTEVRRAIHILLERGDSEERSCYLRSDWDKNTLETEGDGYTKVADAYYEVSELDIVTEKDAEKLGSYSRYFNSEARSLEEEIANRFPEEDLCNVTTIDSDSTDEEDLEPPISIKKLFEDL